MVSDPSKALQPPRVERKMPEILSIAEVDLLLRQPKTDTPKGIRDKAMLEMLYATGIRVSELIHLKMQDVNLMMGYITCRDEKERIVPFGGPAKKALEQYLGSARAALMHGGRCTVCQLFRRSDEPSGVLENSEILCKIRRHYGGYYAAYPASFVCNPSAAKRCGLKECPGDDGTRRYFDDADVSPPWCE